MASRRTTRGGRSGERADDAVSSSASGSARVLVVDDEPATFDLLEPYLSSLGYSVSGARDGDHALEKILTERPGIVLLDGVVSGLSRAEIAQYVRERPELDSVRFVLTGAGQLGLDSDVAADAWLSKPLELETVRSVLEALLETNPASGDLGDSV